MHNKNHYYREKMKEINELFRSDTCKNYGLNKTKALHVAASNAAGRASAGTIAKEAQVQAIGRVEHLRRAQSRKMQVARVAGRKRTSVAQPRKKQVQTTRRWDGQSRDCLDPGARTLSLVERDTKFEERLKRTISQSRNDFSL
jgi:hypothetical protein